MITERPRAQARGMTMYPSDWEAIEAFARKNGFSISLAMRQIIREWLAFKKQQAEIEETT